MRRVSLFLMLVALGGAGCAAPSLPGKGATPDRLFADVPAPPGCDLLGSYTYADGAQRYGVLIYEGRLSIEAVVRHFETRMARENWTFVQKLGTSEVVLRYGKGRGGSQHCDIAVGPADVRGRRRLLLLVTGTGL